MNVLVLGANGFLGLNVVDALRRRGLSPRAGRRRRSNVLALRTRKVPMVECDLDRPRTLEEAFASVDVLVHAAGHYPRHSLDPEGTLVKGVRQLRNVLEAAAKAGVRRVIYVSSTATVAPRSGGPSTEEDRFAAPPGFGVYHNLKWRMEAVVEAEDRFELVTVCPSGCLGPWDLRVGTSALLVALARGEAPPHPDGLVNLVDVRDVAEAVARLVGRDDPPTRLLLSAGHHRLHALLERLALRYHRPGHPKLERPLSASAAIELAEREERASSTERRRPRLSREIVDLTLHGIELDASLAPRTLGLAYRPFAETLDAFDAWARRMGLIPEMEREKHHERV